MASEILIETRVDSDVGDRASAVLDRMGLTLSDAVHILLRRVADDGSFPFDVAGGAAHDAWFREKVMQALEDTRPDVSGEEAEAHFASRRSVALRRSGPEQP